VRIYRFGMDYTPPLITLRSKSLLNGLRDTVILENINHVPFYTPMIYPEKPVVAIIHHVAASQLYIEAPMVAPIIDLLERGISPMLYGDRVVIVPSNSTANQLIRLGYRRVHVIPPGIDYERLRSGSEAYGKRPHSIIYFGRIMRYKRIHHLIKALTKVAEEFPDVKLTIAGRAGSQRYLTQLHGLINRLNLDKHVHIETNVPEGEKIRLLAEAQIYATASAREGWAITVIEANACGTPAVGYDVPGLRDSIRHKETGVLVPPGDVEALAKALTVLLTDDCLRRKLSRNALEWSKRFSWDRSAGEFERVFKGYYE